MAVIAIDCGGSKLAVGVARGGPGTMPEEVARARTPDVAAEIPVAMIDLVAPLMEPGVEAIGIGVAGLVDHLGGSLLWMPHASGSMIPIADLVADRFGVPVAIDNDANLATLAEATLGAGTGHRMVLMVALGTGIGGSLVIDGSIEHGRAHLGEIGHMVLDPDGPECPCGGKGCWEALVSGTALDKASARIVADEPSGPLAVVADGAPLGHHLAPAAVAGDAAAEKALHDAGWWLARGLANLLVALDPDVVVIGGWGAGTELVSIATDQIDGLIEGSGHRKPTPIVPARFGPAAGLIGAAELARSLT